MSRLAPGFEANPIAGQRLGGRLPEEQIGIANV